MLHEEVLLDESADFPLIASRLLPLEFDAEEALFVFKEEVDFFLPRKNPEDFLPASLRLRRSFEEPLLDESAVVSFILADASLAFPC